MGTAIVTLKKGEGRTLKSGGAWVFDNEIDAITGNYENGADVIVRDFDGYPMGRGFINNASKIRVRMMTRNVDQEIDEEFLRMRVRNAWEYRKKVIDTESCRVILERQISFRGWSWINLPMCLLFSRWRWELINIKSRLLSC